MKKQLISEFVKTMLTEGVLSDRFIRDKVYDAIMQQIGVDTKVRSKNQLRDNMDLRKDLDMGDDLEMVELLMELENAFFIEKDIPEKIIPKLRTVRDVINLIKSYRIDENKWKKHEKEYQEYEKGQPSIDMGSIVGSLFKRKLNFQKKKRKRR